MAPAHPACRPGTVPGRPADGAAGASTVLAVNAVGHYVLLRELISARLVHLPKVSPLPWTSPLPPLTGDPSPRAEGTGPGL